MAIYVFTGELVGVRLWFLIRVRPVLVVIRINRVVTFKLQTVYKVPLPPLKIIYM